MPTYDYACPHCGPFEAVRRIAERDVPLDCPQCAAPAARAWLTAPRLADMPAQRRIAMATNERSSHAPESSSQVPRSRHPAGCGCCGSSARADASRPPAPRSFANRRPWMISH